MFKPGSRYHSGPSKATANTICQKCLKKGHYSYECTTAATQRPYKSRPSRTQQLLNPDLAPQLSNEAPLGLERKKGIADEQLARIARERDAKGRRSGEHGYDSDSSSSSVSTISTNQTRSRSSSPERRNRISHTTKDSARTRSASSSNVGNESHVEPSHYQRTRKRIASRSRSPNERSSARTRSRSPYQTSKDTVRRSNREIVEQERLGSGKRSQVSDNRSFDRPSGYDVSNQKGQSTDVRRRRSLSPFSKRLALTQAMNR